MGVVLCFAPCVNCKTVFGFNPMYVPSLTWQGVKQPICLNCITLINPRRIANGLPAIVPHHQAYEPADESEVFGPDE